MRWLVRLALMLSLLLLPLWICAAATEAEPAGSGPTAGAESGALAPSSSEAPSCPEDGASAPADDDTSASEVLLASGSPRVDDGGARPARYQPRAGASPPRVHLEAETPPPRA